MITVRATLLLSMGRSGCNRVAYDGKPALPCGLAGVGEAVMGSLFLDHFQELCSVLHSLDRSCSGKKGGFKFPRVGGWGEVNCV